jgi:hypothetical protein
MSVINTAEASRTLVELGTLSKQAATSLGAHSRNVEVADVSMLYTDPVFSCFLIDASGSMDTYKQSVVEGQFDLIQGLRSSHKCKKGALFVVQYLFSDQVDVLHPFTKLSPTGQDSVVLLKNGNHYDPDGQTALYKSLFYMLEDMAANIAHVMGDGVAPTFTVGVITDGEDTEGGIQPSEVRNVLEELHGNGLLRSSVIVGVTNPKFTKAMLTELQTRLGFQQAISLSQDPREVRRAFVLASQSAVSAQTAAR